MTTTTVTEKCVHAWIIETPLGGATSAGDCRKCGATKRFANWIDDGGFGLDGSRFGAYGNRGRGDR